MVNEAGMRFALLILILVRGYCFLVLEPMALFGYKALLGVFFSLSRNRRTSACGYGQRITRACRWGSIALDGRAGMIACYPIHGKSPEEVVSALDKY